NEEIEGENEEIEGGCEVLCGGPFFDASREKRRKLVYYLGIIKFPIGDDQPHG
ncbi:hypothetical protein AVEN_13836-1, partial [Araneus ventricosus]